MFAKYCLFSCNLQKEGHLELRRILRKLTHPSSHACMSYGIFTYIPQRRRRGKKKNQKEEQKDASSTYLNRPILRRCENISPPGTYSRTMYKLELSWVYEKNGNKKTVGKKNKKTADKTT